MLAIKLESYTHENARNPLLKILSEGLNDPVNALMSPIQILNSNCLHNQLTLETLSLCEEAAKILSGLTENVNFLCRTNIQEKKQDWFLIKSHLKGIIRELKLTDANVDDISVVITFSNRFIYMDEALLKRILYNLLSNSLKFSSGNKVTLIVSKADSGLLINLKDYGIGIPEKEIDLIFKPFVRGSNSGNKPGWGLGLAVVIKILAALNGYIEVSSTQGKGSEFKVFIPCKISNEIKFDNLYS